MSGLDLLIQRVNDDETVSSDSRGKLYIFKIYILHELVVYKKGENFDENVLKSAMDGK